MNAKERLDISQLVGLLTCAHATQIPLSDDFMNAVHNEYEYYSQHPFESAPHEALFDVLLDGVYHQLSQALDGSVTDEEDKKALYVNLLLHLKTKLHAVIRENS